MKATLALKRVPDYSTLAQAAKRLLFAGGLRDLLDRSLMRARRQGMLAARVKTAAIDSSSFEPHRASEYFVHLRAGNVRKTGVWHSTTYRRFPTLTVVCDCASHLILAATTHQGPSPEFDY